MPASILLSWSGGKDSALALDALRADPAVRVVGLLTSVTSGYERISIHGVRRALLDAQVSQLGLPLFQVTLEPGCSNAAYESAFHDALARARLSEPALAGIAFGDLFLQDVRRYREGLLEDSGLHAHFPLWRHDTARMAHTFIDRGFEACVVCVDTTQLAGSFAGRLYDHAFLADLPPEIDRCGENGEFHTFVAAGPIFPERIPYEVGECVLRDGRFMYADLLPLMPVAP